jgi:hypothetical protein
MKQHHIAYSSRLPEEDDWVALNTRIEVMQDIVATLKVSPCCQNDEVLQTIECLREELYNLRDIALCYE